MVFYFLTKNINVVYYDKKKWIVFMKKFLSIIIFICSVLSIQNLAYCENNNLATSEQFQLAQEDTKDMPSIPYQPEYKPAFFKMFSILIALLVLIFLTFWLFKRIMHVKLHQSNLTKNIKILEKRALSPKSLLYLIEVEGKKIVISESNLEIRKIKDLE